MAHPPPRPVAPAEGPLPPGPVGGQTMNPTGSDEPVRRWENRNPSKEWSGAPKRTHGVHGPSRQARVSPVQVLQIMVPLLKSLGFSFGLQAIEEPLLLVLACLGWPKLSQLAVAVSFMMTDGDDA